MKPMIILPPGVMDDENIKLLRENDICVVVAEDPAKVRFVDPIPAASNRAQMEQAAISLSRKILNRGFWNDPSTRDEMCRWYVELLVSGTPLDPGGTIEEQVDNAYHSERLEEARKMAREDARAERAKKKLEKEKVK
jgi:hypothetical protein